ncbi:DUF397 domain-containing protein [Streptomyces sp. ACA25]|uniref:DUF397 domain-containing protein n=1 Tax=Streptomyces sp. ACA25 TaxID=3022596 RepID=UPI002307B308|nr:DUF397 domain-containing protein [Streptomyces sp. ACA25]MDB1087594.1 DUF397 domain-containing protein [Streptomyces sp. ACA25]
MNIADSAAGSPQLNWWKSSYSGSEGGACIEVAASPRALHVRDSKDLTGPALSFGTTQWTTFVDYATRP